MWLKNEINSLVSGLSSNLIDSSTHSCLIWMPPGNNKYKNAGINVFGYHILNLSRAFWLLSQYKIKLFIIHKHLTEEKEKWYYEIRLVWSKILENIVDCDIKWFLRLNLIRYYTRFKTNNVSLLFKWCTIWQNTFDIHTYVF